MNSPPVPPAQPSPKSVEAPPIFHVPPPPPPSSQGAVGRRKPSRARRRAERRGEKCLNCHAALGRHIHFCPHCGQENIDVNISLWHIVREASDEFLRFDSKLALTLVPLVIKPGQLTNEWAQGRRTKYLSPLRLYLTVTFLFFLIAPLVHPLGIVDAVTFTPVDGKKVVSKSTAGSASLGTRDQTTGQKIAETRDGMPRGLAPHFSSLIDRITGMASDRTGRSRKQLVDQFLQHAPTAIFLMLPVFASALWILYIRSRRTYVEHLVFALHCHAFYFFLMLCLVPLPARPGSSVSELGMLIVLVIVPIYSLIALKRMYGQGWIKTIIKFVMLSYAYSVMLGLALLGSLLVAAASLPGPA